MSGSSGGKTWNNPCFVIIDSHRINPPCRTVLQREDINSQAWQGLQVWVFNCTLRRSWFRSWHCLQLSLNFTTHHHRYHHVTLNPTVYPFYWQALNKYNFRYLYDIGNSFFKLSFKIFLSHECLPNITLWCHFEDSKISQKPITVNCLWGFVCKFASCPPAFACNFFLLIIFL